MNLLLISGHGAGDPGVTATINGRAYREADEARKVTAALREALEGSCSVTVYPTDRNAFEDYKKGTLSAVARFPQYDYVLEIHFNALQGGAADSRTKGVECYVTTGETGTEVEEAICRKLAALGLTNRGVKRKDWSVIRTARKAGVPAALLEVCFLDDPDDMAVYTAKFRQIVEGIAEAVREGFGLRKEKAMTYDTFKEYMEQYMNELAAKEPSAWSKGDREWAEKRGIIQGDTTGKKKYRSFVTKEEMAAMLHRAVK